MLDHSMFELFPGERIDTIGRHKHIGVIQSDDVFSFSLDAILLGHFVQAGSRDRVADLGTGNGILPLLLMGRERRPRHVTAVEIQPKLAEMARRSVRGNGFEDLIEIRDLDLKQSVEVLGAGNFDVVLSNPPYRPLQSGDSTLNEYKRIAKHEIYCSWMDVAEAASKLVKTGGKVAVVHRADRLVDVLSGMRQFKVEPKRMRLVHPFPDREPILALVEGIKEGGPELRILPPLIVHRPDLTYTDEMKELYGIS